MKWLVIVCFILNISWAQDSKVISPFLEAAQIYTSDPAIQSSVLRPELKEIVELFQKHSISPELLQKYAVLNFKNKSWPLPSDQYDQWIAKAAQNKSAKVEGPDLSLHAFKVSVIEESDDYLKDDLYAFFFVTDGVIPVGRVTSIYRGLSGGQSFFFSETDRVLFPQGIPSKRPENHLIVDYGLIESDGDDIKDMQKLTSIIIDIAIAVYAAYDPQNAQILINLRKEVKALADLLLNLNNDDRLATGTFAYTTAELNKLMETQTFVEFKKNHKYKKDWEYDIHFRMLRR